MSFILDADTRSLGVNGEATKGLRTREVVSVEIATAALRSISAASSHARSRDVRGGQGTDVALMAEQQRLDRESLGKFIPFVRDAHTRLSSLGALGINVPIVSREYEPGAQFSLDRGGMTLMGVRERTGEEGVARLSIAPLEGPDTFELHLLPLGSNEEVSLSLTGQSDENPFEPLSYGHREDLRGIVEGYRDAMLALSRI